MRDVVIVEGTRTPLIKVGTSFANLRATDLGTIILQELLWKSPVSFSDIDEVIVGEGGASADAANPSRIIALGAGLPESIPEYTVQRNCASGMQAIVNAVEAIALSRRDVVAVVGMESMSSFPVLYPLQMQRAWGALMQARGEEDFLNAQKYLVSLMDQQKDLLERGEMGSSLDPLFALQLGLTDPLVDMQMGQMADMLAREFGITRQEQDEFALRSNQRASYATQQGILASEITPVWVDGEFIKEDNGIRHNQTIEALAKLKPYFVPGEGTVTAGNASQVTDGAGALLLVAKDEARARGWPILAEIISYDFSGCEPTRFGIGPVKASSLALARAGLSFNEIGRVEINEAFAAQVLAVTKAFATGDAVCHDFDCPVPLGEIDPDILNVNGGAVALGHPIGASGLRIVLTLAKEMQRSETEFGLATICIGGGQGGSMILRKGE